MNPFFAPHRKAPALKLVWSCEQPGRPDQQRRQANDAKRRPTVAIRSATSPSTTELGMPDSAVLLSLLIYG